MAKPVEIKRGDTFLVTATYTEPDGTPINLTTVNIKSEVRDSGKNLIASLTVSKLDQSNPLNVGKYTIQAPTDTWPVRDLEWDIQYTVGGIIQSTETITITVIQDITQ